VIAALVLAAALAAPPADPPARAPPARGPLVEEPPRSTRAPRPPRVAPLPPPALADASEWIPDAILDLRYATADNVAGRALYPPGARCLLLAPVADRLARAAARLRAEGYRLRLWDCYRPLSVQRVLWAAFPTRGYVADPDRGGSYHNRAAAVDVALAAADGAEVALPTGFDAFGRRARAHAEDVPPAARENRDRLRRAMEAEGFRVNRMEWWHFDAPEARGAPRLDVPLDREGTPPLTPPRGPGR
jgi:D-alanyl-D-alanine dipeptidase